MSGLTAARTLIDQGVDVTLLDKGRGLGGRVATRWMGDRDHIKGRWDHGAQFATFRSTALIEDLKKWNAWDILDPWIPSYSNPDLPRNRPLEGMNAFPKALGQGLTIHRRARISSIRKDGVTWTLESEEGKTFTANHVICTLPVPQLLDLFQASDLELAESESDSLHSVSYERGLTLLAELDGPSGLGHNGYVRTVTGILESIIDQHQKSISGAHTLVANANATFSLEWYDRDRATAGSVIRAAVQEKISSQIISVQVHGWKFAKAIKRIPEAYLRLDNGLFVAGDGFEAGDIDVPADLHPRIESAMLSGRAAAAGLLASIF